MIFGSISSNHGVPASRQSGTQKYGCILDSKFTFSRICLLKKWIPCVTFSLLSISLFIITN